MRRLRRGQWRTAVTVPSETRGNLRCLLPGRMHAAQAAGMRLHTGERLQKRRKASGESEQQQKPGDASLHGFIEHSGSATNPANRIPLARSSSQSRGVDSHRLCSATGNLHRFVSMPLFFW